MKSVKKYISEAFKINKNTKLENRYKYFPETKRELKDIIKERIAAEGNECDLNDIDTSKITDMSELFYGMTKFNGDISAWDVSNVTNMGGMFFYCESFNHPLNNWNVSKVNFTNSMFKNCYKFNQPLNNWNVSKVEDMTSMFDNCRSFNQNISNWKVYRVRAKKRFYMFDNCPIEIKNIPKFK